MCIHCISAIKKICRIKKVHSPCRKVTSVYDIHQSRNQQSIKDVMQGNVLKNLFYVEKNRFKKNATELEPYYVTSFSQVAFLISIHIRRRQWEDFVNETPKAMSNAKKTGGGYSIPAVPSRGYPRKVNSLIERMAYWIHQYRSVCFTRAKKQQTHGVESTIGKTIA